MLAPELFLAGSQPPGEARFAPPQLFSLKDLRLLEKRFAAPELRIEAAVWDVVVAANALGLSTRASCAGHRRLDLPYVMFGFDYLDQSLGEEAINELRLLNRKARSAAGELVRAFSSARERSPAVRLVLVDGTSPAGRQRLWARLQEQMGGADPYSDPAFLPYKDTFLAEAGTLTSLSRVTPSFSLLSRRQAEMRTFGAFLRRVVASA